MDITETPQTMPTTAGQVPRQVTIGFAYDQSKTAEQAQKRQREIEAHQQVIARLSIATVVFAADTRVVFYNAAYARLWGFAPEWLDDTPSYSDVIEMLREKRLIPEVADFPAFKASELDRFQSLLHPVEDVIHTPHDVTLRRIIAPLPNGGLVQTFEDVTDNMALKRTMTALRETYEGVLDDLDVPVAMFESGGRLQFYNAALAALTGPDDLADNPLFVQWVERWATHVPDPETAAALRQWAGAWVLGQSQAALPLPYLQLVLRTRTLIDGGVVLTLVPLA
jgi:PAS domain-containing protein